MLGYNEAYVAYWTIGRVEMYPCKAAAPLFPREICGAQAFPTLRALFAAAPRQAKAHETGEARLRRRPAQTGK